MPPDHQFDTVVHRSYFGATTHQYILLNKLLRPGGTFVALQFPLSWFRPEYGEASNYFIPLV